MNLARFIGHLSIGRPTQVYPGLLLESCAASAMSAFKVRLNTIHVDQQSWLETGFSLRQHGKTWQNREISGSGLRRIMSTVQARQGPIL